MAENKFDDINESAKNDSERNQSSALNASTVASTDDLTEFVGFFNYKVYPIGLLSFQVQNILKSTQSQFETMSSKIINRIDDVTRRVDDLEKSITDLMTQAGVSPE
jgi:hypothetical protein